MLIDSPGISVNGICVYAFTGELSRDRKVLTTLLQGRCADLQQVNQPNHLPFLKGHSLGLYPQQPESFPFMHSLIPAWALHGD